MTTPKDGSVSSVIIDPEADNTIPKFANHDQLGSLQNSPLKAFVI